MRIFANIYLLSLLSCLLLAGSAFGSLRVDNLAPHTKVPMEVFEDKTGQLTEDTIRIQDLLFSPVQSDTRHWSQGAYWLRFELEQQQADALKFRLYHNYPYTDQIGLFKVQGDRLIPVAYQGDRGLENRLQLGRLPQFEIQTQRGKQSFLLRIHGSGPVHLDFYLSSVDHFLNWERGDTLWVGLLFGCVVVMMAYNLFLGIRLGRITFFIYVSYILGFLTVQGIFTGTLQVLIPSSPIRVVLLNQGLILAAEFTAICGSLFTIIFLSMRKYLPDLFRILLCLYPISCLNMALSFFDLNLSTYLVLLSNGTYTGIILIAALKTCQKRFRPAYYFTAAWAMLLFGSLATMARIYGLAPETSFTQWSQFCGGILEMVLLSLALADKMSFSEQKAAKALKDQEDLLAKVRIDQAIASEREISEKTQRLEIDLRFQLAASIAHRLNNPLNSIQINVEVALKELNSLEQTVTHILPEDSEDDPEVKATRELFKKHFLGFREPLHYIQEGLDRSSDSVKEMRALSGLDGNALSNFRIKDFKNLVRQRLFEHTSQGSASRILLKDDSSNLEVVGNIYTYMSVVDLLLSVSIQSSKGLVSLDITAKDTYSFSILIETRYIIDNALVGAIERCIANILKVSPVTVQLYWDSSSCKCEITSQLQDSHSAA